MVRSFFECFFRRSHDETERTAAGEQSSSRSQGMEMPRERNLQGIRVREATETRGESERDEMNVVAELSTISISLDAGNVREEAIMFQILLGIPVKSLIRFKCVCKSWRSFISHPRFARFHLNRCKLQNPHSSQRLLFPDRDPRQCTMKLLDYERPDFEALIADNHLMNCLVSFRLPLPVPGHYSTVCTCDGLVCLLLYYTLYDDVRFIVIWNPTTDAFKTIRPPGDRFDVLGFGYDLASGDYKIVTSVPSGRVFGDVHVFTLKGDQSWRQVARIPMRHSELKKRCGVYLNGCLHWLTKKYLRGRGVVASILSFDLSDEKFKQVIPLPDIEEFTFQSLLVVIQVCLCLHCSQCTVASDHKSYIMEEYGLKSSWTEFQIPKVYKEKMGYPLCIRSDGKVLGFVTDDGSSDKDELYLYSAEDNSCQIVSYKRLKDPPCSYIETLVSP